MGSGLGTLGGGLLGGGFAGNLGGGRHECKGLGKRDLRDFLAEGAEGADLGLESGDGGVVERQRLELGVDGFEAACDVAFHEIGEAAVGVFDRFLKAGLVGQETVGEVAVIIVFAEVGDGGGVLPEAFVKLREDASEKTTMWVGMVDPLVVNELTECGSKRFVVKNQQQ